MTKKDFRELTNSRILRLDGATGTELAKHGMPPGVAPEMWILENPNALISVQQAYCNAGSDIVYVPSFGGNPFKLAEFGLSERTEEINKKLALLSRQAVPNALVFGDIAPTGQLIEPFGPCSFEDTIAAYRRQIAGLIAGKVDGFIIETMMDIQEARAALLAIREYGCDLPVMVTLTFENSGRTLTGVHPVSALLTLQSLGADAFGCNCSTGPEAMIQIIRQLKPYAAIPLAAKPNAGMPKLVDNRTVFELDPVPFADAAAPLADAGVALIGGCCGTTPMHIAALSAKLGNLTPQPCRKYQPAGISSPGKFIQFGNDQPFVIIGERINPTGKKSFQAELRSGKFDLAMQYAREQTELGATVLDINFGLSGIDEAGCMCKAINGLLPVNPLPLCIDTTNEKAAEAALRLYPGRALFNSISAERSRVEKLLPIAAKYGALPILLPILDSGIPETVNQRIKVIEELLEKLACYNYGPQEAIADALAMTVSANPQAAIISLDFIEQCTRQFRLATICGLSNISFGLPARPIVNTAFLGLAMGRGLSAAIANPATPNLMDLVHGAEVILGKSNSMDNFLNHYSSCKNDSQNSVNQLLTPQKELEHAVLHGAAERITPVLKNLLETGAVPGELVDKVLIPALTEVGNRFERKEYYLPQLMKSADAMRQAMNILEPYLSQESKVSGPVFILATVEGDIHDIGKNIFALLLRNHGFKVIDLGKDVPAKRIVETAITEKADIIGLSALMTTTMPKMKETAELARSRGFEGPIFVGGAAVDENFAASIGAVYGADAMTSVRKALAVTAPKDL